MKWEYMKFDDESQTCECPTCGHIYALKNPTPVDGGGIIELIERDEEIKKLRKKVEKLNIRLARLECE